MIDLQVLDFNRENTMGKINPLVIGDFTVEKPVIQGGMGVGISLHRLAGAVAKAGGAGSYFRGADRFSGAGFRGESFGG